MRNRQVVSNGRVMCWRNGWDVDVDECLACLHFRDIRFRGSRIAEVECDPPRAYLSFADRN